ncbi:MAG: DUF1957 domain-containing protein [Candidatus Kapabacteria bacterium]|nr:DUF1957 domain-containing protein [Candidatus Kapabacteria bacterium]
MLSGNYVLILHTHLPWVLHHGAWPHGEDWLCEAAAECYIPLLNVFNDLKDKGINPNVSIALSPVLCEQLAHPDFIAVFKHYMKQKIEAARRDETDFKKWGYDEHHQYLTRFWQWWYSERLSDFENKYNESIVQSFRKLQDIGAIEIMTCGATHGYSPLLGYDESVNLQFKAATENYKKHFGVSPRGSWLPECAYRPAYNWKSLIPVYPFNQERLRPGTEEILARNGILYFVTDQSLTERADPIGIFTDNSKDAFVEKYFFPQNNIAELGGASEYSIFNVASGTQVGHGTAVAFTRHKEIAMQVWSGEVGYPGEPDYLDFHKKHLGSMLRYWRVTDTKADMMYKSLYHPDWTQKKYDLQANHFIHHIENSLNWNQNHNGKFGTLCTPFDTELFGHWWFEGPEFLRAVIEGISHSPYIKSATAFMQFLKMQPKEIYRLPEGSWGENNNHDVWSNEQNKWTWECIYNDEQRLKLIYEKNNSNFENPQFRRILTQGLRQLMLLQSSDWQFLIHTESAKDYAEQRFMFHHSDFNRHCDLAEKCAEGNEISNEELLFLEEDERRNCIFPELQLEWWSL